MTEEREEVIYQILKFKIEEVYIKALSHKLCISQQECMALAKDYQIYKIHKGRGPMYKSTLREGIEKLLAQKIAIHAEGGVWKSYASTIKDKKFWEKYEAIQAHVNKEEKNAL